MASSGTYNFELNTYQIITGAMRLVGAIQTGEIPPADEYQDAVASLNALIKTWGVNNIHVWTQETFTVPTTAGKFQWTIGVGSLDVNQVRPLKISEARLAVISNGVVTPLIPMSRLDYANLTSPAVEQATGPQYYFYDPQIPYGILSVYPPCIDSLSNLVFVGQRPLQDFDTQRDTPDVPQEWISPLRFALALELAPEYDCPADRVQVIKAMADEKLEVVKTWDQESSGTTTLPFSQAIYQLIAGAIRLVGGVGSQGMPTLGEANNAFYALNAMVQAWQASGIHVWAELDATLFLQPLQTLYLLGAGSTDHACASNNWLQTALASTAVAGAGSITVTATTVTSEFGTLSIAAGDNIGIYLDAGTVFWTTVSAPPSGTTVPLAATLPSQASAGAIVVDYSTPLVRPLKVPKARRYIFAAPGGQPIETPMSVYSRLDYADVPNKNTPGIPTAFFFDPQLNLAQMNIWPAPNVVTNLIKFTVQRPLSTFTTLSSVPDFPVEWNAALRFNLAVEIWQEYADKRALAPKGAQWDLAALKAMADEKLLAVMAWDREPESIYFGVDSFPSTRN